MSRIWCLLACLVVSSPAWAAMYSCPDGRGGTMMKNEPCMGGTALPATSPAIIQQEKIATIPQDIGQRTLPANYEAVIDGAFAHRLKDPDSRKIEYVGQPHGSAVCGMVNAKNSFGGYTGRHQFLAYFSTTGKLEYLKS